MMGKSSLPPGFRFNPTDVELVQYYLKRKVMGKRLHVKVIAEVDIYECAPWDLPDKSCWRSGDLKWYFFSPREKKYASGARMNRATDCGYWKTTGKDRSVLYNAEVVGFIKTLIFHTGRAPRGERTNWVLHEYRLEDKNLVGTGVPQDSYVLCMVFQKDGIGPRSNTQYGAPFKEEDWTDDEVEIDVVPYVNMPEPDLVHANMPEPDRVHANMPEPDRVHANMPEPDRVHANMPEPDRVHANMPEPDRVHANMPEPDLVHANMTEPDLVHANMTEPDLVHANMTEPYLVYPNMPQPDLVYANMSEPYLVLPSNYNSSMATRTNSLESCVSDILPPSSIVLQSVSSNYATTEKPHVSTDDDILSMIDCFTEEGTFSTGDIGKNEELDLFYSGDTNPIADFQRRDIYEDLGDWGKNRCNFLNGHNSMCTPDQMPPGENEPFLELVDIDKPLNGNNSLVTQQLPMFTPPRTFLGETPYEDSYFMWRDDLSRQCGKDRCNFLNGHNSMCTPDQMPPASSNVYSASYFSWRHLMKTHTLCGETTYEDNVDVFYKILGSKSPKQIRLQTYDTEALLPLLQKSEAPRIVDVSSTLGQLRVIRNEKAKKDLGDVDNLTEGKVDKLVEEFLEDVKQDSIESKGWPLNISAYIVSKAALNAYTRFLANKYPQISINAVSPGFTKTNLNQNTGILTVEEAGLGPVKLALIAETGISGLFFDRTEESTFN